MAHSPTIRRAPYSLIDEDAHTEPGAFCNMRSRSVAAVADALTVSEGWDFPSTDDDIRWANAAVAAGIVFG